MIARPEISACRYLVPEIHDSESGRLDAKRISSLFGVPLAVLARMLGRGPSTVHKTPDAPSLQCDLTIFERIAAALLHLVGTREGLRIWLNASNPDLGGKTPIALIQDGNAEVVA